MPIERKVVDGSKFNPSAILPYELRIKDFEIAMQDVYDFFFDVNTNLATKGLDRLDDMIRPAIMSGLLSDMLTASMAKHARALTVNGYFNGHPDLSGPRDARRFPEEPAGRTRNEDRDPSYGRA